MSSGDIVVGITHSSPRADKFDREDCRWSSAVGLEAVRVVELHIPASLTAARETLGYRVLPRTLGDDCRNVIMATYLVLTLSFICHHGIYYLWEHIYPDDCSEGAEK